MPASKQKYIMGERFFLLKSNLTKAEAQEIANKKRKSEHKVRAEKISRGNYNLWVDYRP